MSEDMNEVMARALVGIDRDAYRRGLEAGRAEGAQAALRCWCVACGTVAVNGPCDCEKAGQGLASAADRIAALTAERDRLQDLLDDRDLFIVCHRLWEAYLEHTRALDRAALSASKTEE